MRLRPEYGIESLLEADLGQLAVARRRLEELELVITHGARDQVRRNRRDRRVEISYDRVVVAPRVLDGVFYGSELRLEIAKSTGRLELGIGFDRHSETAKRCRELTLSRRALRRTSALSCYCSCSRLSYGIESPALMTGVAFYRFDQIGDEISAPFELDVDVGPCVLGSDSKRDKAVVNESEEKYDCDDECQDADEHGFWGGRSSPKMPPKRATVNAFVQRRLTRWGVKVVAVTQEGKSLGQ